LYWSRKYISYHYPPSSKSLDLNAPLQPFTTSTERLPRSSRSTIPNTLVLPKRPVALIRQFSSSNGYQARTGQPRHTAALQLSTTFISTQTRHPTSFTPPELADYQSPFPTRMLEVLTSFLAERYPLTYLRMKGAASVPIVWHHNRSRRHSQQPLSFMVVYRTCFEHGWLGV